MLYVYTSHTEEEGWLEWHNKSCLVFPCHTDLGTATHLMQVWPWQVEPSQLLCKWKTDRLYFPDKLNFKIFGMRTACFQHACVGVLWMMMSMWEPQTLQSGQDEWEGSVRSHTLLLPSPKHSFGVLIPNAPSPLWAVKRQRLSGGGTDVALQGSFEHFLCTYPFIQLITSSAFEFGNRACFRSLAVGHMSGIYVRSFSLTSNNLLNYLDTHCMSGGLQP